MVAFAPIDGGGAAKHSERYAGAFRGRPAGPVAGGAGREGLCRRAEARRVSHRRGDLQHRPVLRLRRAPSGHAAEPGPHRHRAVFCLRLLRADRGALSAVPDLQGELLRVDRRRRRNHGVDPCHRRRPVSFLPLALPAAGGRRVPPRLRRGDRGERALRRRLYRPARRARRAAAESLRGRAAARLHLSCGRHRALDRARDRRASSGAARAGRARAGGGRTLAARRDRGLVRRRDRQSRTRRGVGELELSRERGLRVAVRRGPRQTGGNPACARAMAARGRHPRARAPGGDRRAVGDGRGAEGRPRGQPRDRRLAHPGRRRWHQRHRADRTRRDGA